MGTTRKTSIPWMADSSFCGWLRGALAFIMAKEAWEGDEHNDGVTTGIDAFFSHTIVIIIFISVILNGILIKPLIYFFKLSKERDTDSLDNVAGKVKVLPDVTGKTLIDILGGTNQNGFEIWFAALDRKLQKWLIKDRDTRIKLNGEDYTMESKAARDWLEAHDKNTDQINIQKIDVMD